MDATKDFGTAQAFATSWNNLPQGSVYTFEQFADWMAPLTEADVKGKQVLELGCGNASLLFHMTRWSPSEITGVDLGDSVRSAKANLGLTGYKNFQIRQDDLVAYRGQGVDVAYCIGVIHHLKDPQSGFTSLVANVKPGGAFHGWVYAKEGNGVVIALVEPLRKIFSRFPWWFTKYAVATPVVVPFYLYAKAIALAPKSWTFLKSFPLYEYSLWIARRSFSFFRHVAFDQLVTPQTAYIDRGTIERWLASDSQIEPGSTYILMRNGNSWKFGGRIRAKNVNS